MFLQYCNLMIIRYVKLLHHKMTILYRQVGPLEYLPTSGFRARTDTQTESVCVQQFRSLWQLGDTSNRTIPSSET